MARTLNVFTFLAILCAAGATSCTGGKCDIGDEVSLIQAQKIVTSGSERSAQQPEAELESEDEAETEAFTLEETTKATPPGCFDMGCQGSGPNCGGNTFDCSKYGWHVTGWYKTCNLQDTCATGWKVRCARCDATAAVTDVAMPAEAAGPAVWTEPAAVAAPLEPTPGPPAAYDPMPTDPPLYLAAKYDHYLVSNATATLAAAKKNLTAFEKALEHAEKEEKKTHDNITHFESLQSHATSEHETNRDAAVHFAKKVQLANITVFKATNAMANAYYAEKGAAQQAQSSLIDVQNANAQKRDAEKALVDAEHAVEIAKTALHIGNVAVDKASSDLSLAKKASHHHHWREHNHNKDKMEHADKMAKWAMQEAVQKTVQKAFIESSQGRNDSNVPPFASAGASV